MDSLDSRRHVPATCADAKQQSLGFSAELRNPANLPLPYSRVRTRLVTAINLSRNKNVLEERKLKNVLPWKYKTFVLCILVFDFQDK
jgi:hypothetical protein